MPEFNTSEFNQSEFDDSSGAVPPGGQQQPVIIGSFNAVSGAGILGGTL